MCMRVSARRAHGLAPIPVSTIQALITIDMQRYDVGRDPVTTGFVTIAVAKSDWMREADRN